MISGNKDVLAELKAVSDDSEVSRSSYWEEGVGIFKVNDDGTTSGSPRLGSASRKMGPLHTFVHAVLGWPICRMGRHFRHIRQSIELGKFVARRQGRQYTQDIIRQSLSLGLIREYISLDSGEECNLVIGDGYGILASLFLLTAPHRTTIVCNLNKALHLDVINILKSLPEVGVALVRTDQEMEEAVQDNDIKLIAVQADFASIIKMAPIGLAANIHSMNEMTMPVIENYFRILRNNQSTRTAFYCCNKVYKYWADGTEIKFDEYPWYDVDEILHDSIAPWSQWLIDKSPPFWRYRGGAKKRYLAQTSRL